MKTRIAQVIKFFGIMAIVAAFAAAAFPAPSFASSARVGGGKNIGSALVTVYDATISSFNGDREPVAGAVVQVVNASGVSVMKTTTDANGQVNITLPEGNYKLNVIAKGFNNGGGDVRIQAGTTQDVLIGLTRTDAN